MPHTVQSVKNISLSGGVGHCDVNDIGIRYSFNQGLYDTLNSMPKNSYQDAVFSSLPVYNTQSAMYDVDICVPSKCSNGEYQ